jgi:hypothetical protein
MNTIYEFVKAKLFWNQNEGRREPLPTSCNTWEQIESRMPDFTEFHEIATSDLFPPPQEKGYGIMPAFKVPRHFGSNGNIQSSICNWMRIASFNCFVGNKGKKCITMLETMGMPCDGGTFWDGLIGRSEGDTPIVICEFTTILNYIMIKSATPAEREFYAKRRLPMNVGYIKRYRPAQLNNHMTWKALYLATSAVVMNNRELLEHAYYLYTIACDQIKEDGSMPLELARGNKSCSYTLMNLEALVHLRNLFGVDTPKVKVALDNFNECLTDHDNWKKRYKLGGQIHPNDMPASWGWINMFDKPVKFSVPDNAYVSMFSEYWT